MKKSEINHLEKLVNQAAAEDGFNEEELFDLLADSADIFEERNW